MSPTTTPRSGALAATVLIAFATVLAACSGATGTTPKATAAAATFSAAASPRSSMPAAGSVSPGVSAAPGASGSPEPDASAGTKTGGDIPDNAVYLTYSDTAHAFSIQYVEGWQINTTSDGVLIHDKDSSETVQVLAPVSDPKSYISGTDLPVLQGTGGFKLITQNTVVLHGAQVAHLQYEQLSPPDPVTSKRLPSLVDRYYISGAKGLAVVTFSTPKSVDNVDAFKLMAESFTWK